MIHKIKGIFCDHEEVFGDRKIKKFNLVNCSMWCGKHFFYFKILKGE